MKIYKAYWRRTVTIIVTVFFSQALSAGTIEIGFESQDNRMAIPGVEATNIYHGSGIRFVSRPTIQRDTFSLFKTGNQLLQQGRFRRSSNTGAAVGLCSPLEIEFLPTIDVRVVSMRIVNRHLRYYLVTAYSGIRVVDEFEFWPRSNPSQPTPLHRDITLRNNEDEGYITRVVIEPPADCFDLVSIDNILLETQDEPPTVKNSCEILPDSPLVFSSGSLRVPQTWLFDLDLGLMPGPNNTSHPEDIKFRAQRDGVYDIGPLLDSHMAVGDLSHRGLDGCRSENFTRDYIPLEDIPVGSYVCVETNENRISQFCINSIVKEPWRINPNREVTVLYIIYTTWRNK